MMNRRFFFAALMAAAETQASTGGAGAPATDTKADADTKAKEPAAPKHNVSSVARAAILDGLSNADALKRVQAEFPEAKTTVASIAWYRNDLRKKGYEVKSPARPKVEKPAKAEKAADAKTDAKAKPTKAEKPAAEAAPATQAGSFE